MLYICWEFLAYTINISAIYLYNYLLKTKILNSKKKSELKTKMFHHEKLETIQPIISSV